MRPIPKSIVEQIIDEVSSGKPMVQVAREMGISYSSVYKYAREGGVPTSRRRIAKERIDKAVDEVRGGKSIKQVAEETGMSYQMVWKCARERGVSTKREKKVTEREKQILAYIVSYIEENGKSPTYREVAAFFEISVERVHQIVRKLAKKGLISYKPRYGRSIEVLIKKERA